MREMNLVLANRYQALARLGSGDGVGVEQYLGRDLRLARPVVIQVIPSAGDDLFAPPARLMASLDHPAVASVYDWGQEGGLAYLVREYVPGQSLGRLLMECGVLPAAQAAAIGAEVASALAAAHRIGLAHGSLDTTDVILSHYRVTVVGFGAAWMREAAAAARRPAQAGAAWVREAAGQPGQAGATGGRDHDRQADLRALGAMLYQMVTGAPPEQWPVVWPMAETWPSLLLLQVIEGLMAPRPGARYQAAEVVRADLLHLSSGQPASAWPATAGPPSLAPWEAAGTVETNPQLRVPADAAPSGVPASGAGHGSAERAEPAGGDWPHGRDAGPWRGRWTGVWMGMIVGLALFGGAVASGMARSDDPGKDATVQTPSGPRPASVTAPRGELPDVVGLDEHAAIIRLERDGFVANLSRQPSDQVPGMVTSQSPAAGERPPRGATVFLTVSSGPGDTTVPGGPGDPLTTESPRTPPTTVAQASR
jgi:serine/threonine-protein kinase